MPLQHVAFGLIMLCSSAMNNLFVTFYLNLFVNHSQLQSRHFYLGQTLYLVWNAANDPLFGFFQDWLSSSSSSSRTTTTTAAAATRASSANPRVLTRLKTIRYGGLAWCMAFAAVWFPPDSSSSSSYALLVHFTVSICLYDAFLTLVELSHTALLSELTTASQERAKYNAYSAVLAGLGSFSNFFGQYYYPTKQQQGTGADLGQFRTVMVGVSLACAVGFVSSTLLLSRTAAAASAPSSPQIDSNSKPRTSSSSGNAIAAFLLGLRKHYNLWVFILISAMQTFDCSFEKTSFVTVLDSLTTLSSSERGVIVSLAFFLPWLITFLLTKPIQRRGVGRCISFILCVRVAVCVALYLLPAWWLLLANRVCSELICRLIPLVLADLVDEDRFLNQRDASETKAASVIGTCQFFTKITASLGPMLTFSIMVSSSSQTEVAAVAAARGGASWALVPLACVCAQLALWTRAFFLYRDVDYYAKVKCFVERV